jgi:hypothetical protein
MKATPATMICMVCWLALKTDEEMRCCIEFVAPDENALIGYSMAETASTIVLSSALSRVDG